MRSSCQRRAHEVGWLFDAWMAFCLVNKTNDLQGPLHGKKRPTFRARGAQFQTVILSYTFVGAWQSKKNGLFVFRVFIAIEH